MVYNGKSQLKMDDWGYTPFRKPPCIHMYHPLQFSYLGHGEVTAPKHSSAQTVGALGLGVLAVWLESFLKLMWLKKQGHKLPL